MALSVETDVLELLNVSFDTLDKKIDDENQVNRTK